MDRRGFICGVGLVIFATPLGAEAQSPSRVYRIGMLELTSAASNAGNLEAFRQGLKELGYVEGQNVVIDYRSADGLGERFPALAAELVRHKVDLIVTRGTLAALAAKNATTTAPIVMAASGDPLRTGLVASLARPGGNVTGLSTLNLGLAGKRIELVKEAIPGILRVGLLIDMSSPISSLQTEEFATAARRLGLQVQLLDVRRTEDVAAAFDTAARQRVQAISVLISTVTQANDRRIVELAAKYRLPAVYAARSIVEAGGLMAYAVEYRDLYRRTAVFADKIFRGAKPADLPVEQPTKFELVINLKTAKALGLTIPPSLLVRADQVIE